ncbi:MAG: hypothetical protein U0228_33510 [Myxococcaceae bacterium]
MESEKKTSFAKAAGALFAAIGVGAIGSGAWELVAKPGLSWVIQGFLNVVSLGSVTFRDGAYASAAMDPTGRPSEHVLGLIQWVPFYAVVFLLVYVRQIIREMNEEKEPAPSSQEERIARLEELKNRIFKLRKRAMGLARASYVFGAIGALLVLIMIVNNARLSQQLAIWRTFHNNQARLGAVVSQERIRQFEASFASMTTRNDYLRLEQEMRAAGAAGGVSLPANDLW